VVTVADKAKLTKSLIEAAAPRNAEYVIWDTEVPGLGLRIRPTGRKVFIVVFRHGGNLRKLTLKRFGAMTLDQARREARVALGQVAKGEDPTEAKRASRAPEPEPEPVPTLKMLVDRYLKQYAERHHKPHTLREDRRLLNKVVLEKIGEDTPVVAIGRAHATKLREDLGDHPAQANAALRRLSAILSYAESIAWRPEGSNPCGKGKLAHYKENKRRRYLTAEELGRLGKVLVAEEAKRELHDDENKPQWSRSAALLVKLLLYTGLRPGEVLSLRWEYLDTERGLLNLPDTKTGARTVPLSDPALALLKTATHIDDNPWIVPSASRKNAHLNNPTKPWALIRKAAEIEDVHLHDLRHTFASWAASGGTTLYIVADMLGHRQASTTTRYAHLAQDPVKQAADRTAGEIAAAMEGREPAKVIDLPR
jgi:integrase